MGPSSRFGAATDSGAGNPAGVLGVRRRALPTGRAVVGGFLIAVAALIVFGVALANREGDTAQYAVAGRVLAPGTVISAGDLTTSGAKLPAAARSSAFRQGASLIGRTVAVEVTPGELIESSMLAPTGSPAGIRPVSVAVDPDSLGSLTVGDVVDVLATTTVDDSTQVTVVMRGASLIDVSQSSPSLESGGTAGALVTLGVSSLSEAEAVVAASHGGTITLVLAEPSDGVGPGPGSAP